MGNKSKIYVGESMDGKGVFAGQFIKKGEQIIEFQGRIMEPQNLPTPYDAVKDHYVQIEKNSYMGPSGKEDDLINHSCDPNSGLVIKDRMVMLVAIRNISKDKEITWDYSTTMDEDNWEMDCCCGSVNCRGKIRNFKHLSMDIKEKYAELAIVPKYNLKYISRGLVNK